MRRTSHTIVISAFAASFFAPSVALCETSAVQVAKESTVKDVVREAFLETHDGWSSDEVLLRDELNEQFVATCRRELPRAPVEEFNWTLLNLRKAGKLKVKVTKRRQDKHDQYQHLAEIAARTVQDKHNVTTDRIMCNETMRAEFDEQAKLIAKDVDAYLMRKAAFGLRKKRRLKPELVLRIADWGREITIRSANELANDIESIPQTPGVYIFRDPTGYLYIGESINLRERLAKHLDESDRESLANYLRKNGIDETTIEMHAFPKESRAKKVAIRRAYESELIASRKPRFNLRP